MNKLVNKIISAVMSALLVLGTALPACADELIDINKTGSVTVTIQENDTKNPISGGSVGIYQIAEVVITDNGDNIYEYTKSFASCEEDLLSEDKLSSASTAVTFAEYIEANKIEPEQTKDVSFDGTAVFSDLTCGVYMVGQIKNASGYEAIKSFLVTVPYRNSDGSLTYDVDAAPKTEGATAVPSTETPTETEKEKEEELKEELEEEEEELEEEEEELEELEEELENEEESPTPVSTEEEPGSTGEGSKNVQTNDNSYMLIFAGLGIILIIGAFLLLRRRKGADPS